jgi:RNA polymerase sigma-70 factor (ECF subfamily)
MNAMALHDVNSDSFRDEDRPLIEAFLAGEESAFDALVQRYQVLAYRVARSVVGTHADADDVAQDAFLKAYRKMGTFRGDSSFRTWFLRIVQHTALNHRRSWWVRRKTGSEPLDLPQPGAGAEPEEGPEGLLLEDERRRRVLEAIEGLPARQKETVQRRLQGNQNYAGIAREMGVSVGTVKANFHHAVRNLRRALEEEPSVSESPGSDADEPA